MPNPCSFAAGEWIRAASSDYYYVGAGEFLYKVDRLADNAVPKCDGVSIFGKGRTFDTGPEKFCNGYYKSVGENKADVTCARCLAHMQAHNMEVGKIDGSPSSCGNFGTSLKRVCENQKISLSCMRGTIDLSD